MSEILIDSELLSCPICADTFVDACDTGCGHTFCDFCLNSCLENRPDKCPVCSKDPSPVHPAFTIRAICNAFAPHVVEDTTITVESEKELGNSSYYKNKYAQAILHYNNAINKCTHSDPKNSYLYNNRSQCFIHLRQFKRALDDCDEAIRLNDDNIKAYMRKGLCLRMLGLYEESRVAYNKATNLDKNSEWKQQIQDGIRFLPASTPAQQQAAAQQQPQQQAAAQQQQQQRPQQPQQPVQQPQQPQQPFNPQQPQYYFPYGQPPQGYPNSQYPQFNQQHARYQYPGHYTVRTTGNPNQNFHPNYAYQQQVPPQQQPIHQQQQPQQPQQPQQVPPPTTSTTQPTNVNTTVPSSTTSSSSSTSSTSNSARNPTTTAPPAAPPTTTASTSTSSSGKGRNRSSSGNCKSQ